MISPRVLLEFEVVSALLEAIKPTSREQHEEAVWAATEMVGPNTFSNAHLGEIFFRLRDMFAAGEDTSSPGAVVAGLPKHTLDTMASVFDHYVSPTQLLDRATKLLAAYRTDTLRDLCEKSLDALETGRGTQDGGRRLADRLATRLMDLYADTEADGTRSAEPEEIVDRLRERVVSPKLRGITVPHPTLEHEIGPIMPGDVVAVVGYPGSGKSTFTASGLFVPWVFRRQPCIAFPTEMGDDWLMRGLAGQGGVSQRVAEKDRWRDNPAEVEKMLATLEDLRGLKDYWYIVSRGTISVDEIVRRTRILRQRWRGQHVLVFVDHMHRLDYGGEEANKLVGAATRKLKSMAMDDRDGGLSFVLLFQPRKPDQGSHHHKPVTLDQIRGDAAVGEEVNVQVSPFRPYVKLDPDISYKTPWGTRRAAVNNRGYPILTEPDDQADDRKKDDERVWLKIGKRRVGGEGGYMTLAFNPITGAIWEEYDEHGYPIGGRPQPTPKPRQTNDSDRRIRY